MPFSMLKKNGNSNPFVGCAIVATGDLKILPVAILTAGLKALRA